MPSLDLVTTSGVAFAAVFTLLAFLAVVMRVLVALFPPPRSASTDAVVIATVASVVASRYPGARITRIEEER